MLALALLFIAQTEMHYGHWECICVKDKVLADTRGEIKGLHMLLEGRAGMRRFLSQLLFKKHIPLLPSSARRANGASLPCLSFG